MRSLRISPRRLGAGYAGTNESILANHRLLPDLRKATVMKLIFATVRAILAGRVEHARQFAALAAHEVHGLRAGARN